MWFRSPVSLMSVSPSHPQTVLLWCKSALNMLGGAISLIISLWQALICEGGLFCRRAPQSHPGIPRPFHPEDPFTSSVVAIPFPELPCLLFLCSWITPWSLWSIFSSSFLGWCARDIVLENLPVRNVFILCWYLIYSLTCCRILS